MSVVLSTSKKVISVLTSDEVPKKIEHDRGVNLLFKLFLPFLDDYLYEESNYAEQITKKYIDDWVSEKVLYKPSTLFKQPIGR
jgi:recyclin-1